MIELKNGQKFWASQNMMITFRTEINDSEGDGIQLNFLDSKGDTHPKGSAFKVTDVNELYLTPKQEYAFTFDDSTDKVFVSNTVSMNGTPR